VCVPPRAPHFCLCMQAMPIHGSHAVHESVTKVLHSSSCIPPTTKVPQQACCATASNQIGKHVPEMTALAKKHVLNLTGKSAAWSDTLILSTGIGKYVATTCVCEAKEE
jgi:hypothetical protein